MNGCPSQDMLLGLLESRLPEADLDEIVIHIEICLPCQAELEELTRGEVWKSTLREAPNERGFDGGARSCRSGPEATVDLQSAGEINAHESCSEGTGTDPAVSDPARSDNNSTQSQSNRQVNLASSGRTVRLPDCPEIPGYEILEHIGEGGMGVVYKARQVGLNRLVALKMIRGGSHVRLDHRARFSIEAEAVARLRHPNILQIYDIGEAAGMPFVSLELLDGGSLADRLDGTPQPGRSSAELLGTLAQAVLAAHQAGIIHRDLKPSNVLFADDGTPKVTDFGLAKRLESDDGQTESGQIMGSPCYMAPEQAKGQTRAIGPAADVYALGAILYEMLTGRPPFKGETPIETIRQVIDDDPVPPSRLVPRVARDLETICLKCLQKESNKRYPSAQAFADDLGRYVNHQPIKARPISLRERAAKWSRRHPVAATLMGLATASAVLMLFAWSRYDREMRRLERAENQQIMADRSNSTSVILKAKEGRVRADLDSLQTAKSSLEKLLAAIAKDAKQADLFNQATSDLKEVETLLMIRRTRLADQERSKDFEEKLHEVYIQDAHFTGLDVQSNRDATRRAARAALEVFGSMGPDDSWELRPLPVSFDGTDLQKIKNGCYEVLLILADAIDDPSRGLRLLVQAGRLRPATRAYHLRRSACLTKAKDAVGADRERLAADKIPPTTASDYFLIGWEEYERGDLGAANRHLDFALRLEPGHFLANCASAVCNAQFQQFKAAIGRLDACVDRKPEYAWLYVWRALASGQLAARVHEQLKNQVSQANENLRLDGEQYLASALEDYGRAMRLVEKRPDDLLRWVVLVNRGSLRAQYENWDQAASDLEAAIRLDGRRPLAYTVLAAVYQRQNKPDAAFEQYSHAIALKPKWAPFYRLRANADIWRTDQTPDHRSRALRDLDQAIRFESPANEVLVYDHMNRAKLLLADHREPEALAACEAAIKARPRDLRAHQLRIEVLLEMKKYDDVIRSCDAILAQEKSSARIYELRGLARVKIKEFPGAIDDFTQAIEIQPDRALLYVRRGDLYLASDAPKLARHDFDVATRLDPSDGDAVVGRGAARVRLGEHREAVIDAQKGIAMSTPTAHRLYQAARTYARAAAVARSDPRLKARDAAVLVGKCQDRGASLLRDALQKMPAAEREAFWRDVVQLDPDPAMNALRRRLRANETVGSRQ